MEAVCEKCKTTMRWVLDFDGSYNLVCDTCKYFIQQVPKHLFSIRVDHMDTYGNHSCNDCMDKKCPISNHLALPNDCSYYDPPTSARRIYPEWRTRELMDMANLGVVCPVVVG